MLCLVLNFQLLYAGALNKSERNFSGMTKKGKKEFTGDHGICYVNQKAVEE